VGFKRTNKTDRQTPIYYSLKDVIEKKKKKTTDKLFQSDLFDRGENWLCPRAFIQIGLAIMSQDDVARNSCEI